MGLLKNVAAAVLKSLSPSVQAFLKGDEVIANGAAMVNGYEQSTWVYTAVTALARNVSQIPFRITQGAEHDENLVASGAVVGLFKQPHQFLDRFQFWELLVTWLMIRGEAFVVALDERGRVISVRDAGRRQPIAQMLILSPDRFWHIIEEGTLQGWRYTGMNYNDPPMDSQIFLPEEVMQLRLPNPFLFWRGLSPLSVAMLAASTDYASAQFMKGLMLNNADTGVIVTTDQQASDEQKEQILAALRARKRMAGTADRPLFLWGGAKVEKPTVSSADMQFLENRKLNRLEIGAVFGVPATVMGFSEDANRAIAGQERLNFIQQTILPLCARLEAFIEPVVKSFGAEFMGYFHSENLPIMQEARRERGQAALQFFGMGVPLNDINRVFDLGLPEYAWGNTGYLPLNLQVIGSTPKAPAGKAVGGALPAVEKMLGIFKNCGLPVLRSGTAEGGRISDCGFETLETVARTCDDQDSEDQNACAVREFRKAVNGIATSPQSTIRNQKSEISEDSVAAACDCRPNEECKKGDLHGSRPAARRNAVSTRRPETAATVSSHARVSECEASIAGAVKAFRGRMCKLFFEQRGRVLEKMSGFFDEAKAFTPEAIKDLFDVDAENEVLKSRARPLLILGLEFGGTQLFKESGLQNFLLSPDSAEDFLRQCASRLTEVNRDTRYTLGVSLRVGVGNGESHDALMQRVKDVFQAAADNSAENIAMCEVNSAVNAGRLLAMRQSGVEKKASVGKILTWEEFVQTRK